MATAGKAFGVWYDKTNTFQFKLPAGVYAADMSFMGARASHVAWEQVDYQHTSDVFLLGRAFSQNSKKPQVVNLPLPRVADFSRYWNPTRPAHLRGGALVRHRRSYSPNESRSVQTVGLGTESCILYSRHKLKKQS